MNRPSTMVSHKRYVGVLLAALVLPTATVVALNLWVDPLLLFHLDREGPQVYYGKTPGYYSNAGIARHYDYDLALFGASTSRDVIASQLSAAFGMPAQKFAFKGGTHAILRDAFEFVHRVSDVEHAIFDVIPETLDRAVQKRHRDWHHVAPLYDANRVNDLLFYFSSDMARLSLEKMAAKRNRPDNLCPSYRGFIYELDHLGVRLRFNECENELRFHRGDLEAHHRYWQRHWPPLVRWDTELHRRIAHEVLGKALSEEDLQPSGDLDNIRGNVSEFRRLAVTHREVSFVFLLPPRPAYRYTALMLNDPENFIVTLRSIAEVVHRLAPLPNVRVHAFGDWEFTMDWENYLEGSHYHPEIAQHVMQNIAAGRGRLTPENVNEYLRGFVAAIAGTEIPASIYRANGESQ